MGEIWQYSIEWITVKTLVGSRKTAVKQIMWVDSVNQNEGCRKKIILTKWAATHERLTLCDLQKPGKYDSFLVYVGKYEYICAYAHD